MSLPPFWSSSVVIAAVPQFKDVVPTPQNDGEGGVIQIAYPEGYRDTMEYVRGTGRRRDVLADAVLDVFVS